MKQIQQVADTHVYLWVYTSIYNKKNERKRGHESEMEREEDMGGAGERRERELCNYIFIFKSCK